MEDKTFELMTKMYGEFSEFQKGMNEFSKETKNDIISLENEIDTTSKALFDCYKQTFEKLTSLEGKVELISNIQH
jgi:hypothetical protein